MNLDRFDLPDLGQPRRGLGHPDHVEVERTVTGGEEFMIGVLTIIGQRTEFTSQKLLDGTV